MDEKGKTHKRWLSKVQGFDARRELPRFENSRKSKSAKTYRDAFELKFVIASCPGCGSYTRMGSFDSAIGFSTKFVAGLVSNRIWYSASGEYSIEYGKLFFSFASDVSASCVRRITEKGEDRHSQLARQRRYSGKSSSRVPPPARRLCRARSMRSRNRGSFSSL